MLDGNGRGTTGTPQALEIEEPRTLQARGGHLARQRQRRIFRAGFGERIVGHRLSSSSAQ